MRHSSEHLPEWLGVCVHIPIGWWGIRVNPNPPSKQGFCAQIFNAVFQNSPALMILFTANGNEHHRQLQV
jgi:hypothetical protein